MQEHSSFGQALVGKAQALRLPLDHPQISYLAEQYPEKFPLPFVGCTLPQIEEIKGKQAVLTLPRIYQEFLLSMGVACGDIFLGQDVTHHYLTKYSFRLAVNKQLRLQGFEELDQRYFVFFSHQGHSFGYFPLFLGDDPPIYGYGEPLDDPDDPYRNGPVEIEPHLSIYLTRFIAERESPAAQAQFLTQYALPYR